MKKTYKEKKAERDKRNLMKIREYKLKHGITDPLTQEQCVEAMKVKKNKHNANKRIKPTKRNKKRQRKKETFYSSKEWRELRYKAFKLHGRSCLCCGASPPDVVLHVDHIRPRSLYPELELDINNLQILCKDCNLGKSNKDSIDYRQTTCEV